MTGGTTPAPFEAAIYDRAGRQMEPSRALPGHALVVTVRRRNAGSIALLRQLRLRFPGNPMVVRFEDGGDGFDRHTLRFLASAGGRAIYPIHGGSWPEVVADLNSVAHLAEDLAAWTSVMRREVDLALQGRVRTIVATVMSGGGVKEAAEELNLTRRALSKSFKNAGLPTPDTYRQFAQLTMGMCSRARDPHLSLFEEAFLSGYAGVRAYTRARSRYWPCRGTANPPLGWEWLACAMRLHIWRD